MAKHDDLLFGAGEIAQFLFGEDTPKTRRRIYYVAERRLAPFGRLGGTITASRRRLADYLAGEMPVGASSDTAEERSP